MKDVPEFVLVVCLAVLALGVVKLLNEVNKRLLAGGPIWGGRIQPRGSSRFPLIPTNDSEVERKRPAVWLGATSRHDLERQSSPGIGAQYDVM